jgi:pyruvate dehydrogenase E1 component beta subunit
MGFAPTPCPTTPTLEDHFYPNAQNIAAAANDLVKGSAQGWIPELKEELKSVEFKGPL